MAKQVYLEFIVKSEHIATFVIFVIQALDLRLLDNSRSFPLSNDFNIRAGDKYFHLLEHGKV